MNGFAGETGIAASIGGGGALTQEQQAAVSQFSTGVNTPQDLPNNLPIDTLVYVKSTTSLWQNTANGWIDSEADINLNQDISQLLITVASLQNSLSYILSPLEI